MEEQNNSKNIIIILLLLVNIGLAGFICYDEFFTKKETKGETTTVNNNATTTDESTTTNNGIDLNSYVGEWYFDQDSYTESTSGKSPSNLVIKSVTDDSLLVNFYPSRVGNFDNFVVPINNNKGKFTANSENASPINQNQEATISGEIELMTNSVKLTITSSNVGDLKVNQEFIFSYKK